ncbi:uncharacterized protein EV154DRAFT_492895 [Mucor mucedo]|uniref:uncharacterized protein n=1 Tax=Mucor mucedo TaxID=29922 RepID=UPI002220192E|nr:uncharacterized protein EV154DRAFT_492895 [Mucor mucedo]KAI7896274.1 hypothetical protein EV154DRAFT_492895 [Mucor mucedo]
MSTPYNFSKHSCCIDLCFDEDTASISYYRCSIFAQKRAIDTMNEKRASLLYNAITGDILAIGVGADVRKDEEDRKEIFFVNNILVELYDIYIKTKLFDYIHDAHDTVILNAVVIFLRHTRTNFAVNNIPNDGFHYVVSLPTFWDFEVREKIIRPLFVQAGLINESDDYSRLLFFTVLESNFRYLQNEYIVDGNRTIQQFKYGREYILCAPKFIKGKCIVTLDLISVQYPLLGSGLDSNTAKSLKSICFSVPVEEKLKNSILLCLKDKGIKVRSIKDGLLERLIYRHISCQPFFYGNQKTMPFIDVHIHGLGEKETSSIQSLHVKEINQYLFCAVSKDFLHHIKTLSGNTNKKIDALIYIRRNLNVLTDEFEAFDDELKVFIQKSIEKHFKYRLFSFDKSRIRDNQKEFGNSSYLKVQCGSLLNDETDRSHDQRSPATIPRNLALQGQCKMVSRSLFKNSQPNIIINIDIFLESVKHVSAFVGDDNLVERLSEFKSLDIRPLDSYFKHLLIYQKPVLHTTKRMREFMEENFGDYLDSYPGVRRHPIQSLYKDIASATILESLGKSEMASFFSTANNSIIKETYGPITPIFQTKYTHIFLLMYLSYINTLVSVLLDKHSGNDWRAKNLGYVLTIEASFMEYIDISEEDIQQLFYIGNVPQELAERRKVRLCNIGSCLMPVIQKIIGQEFKLKSFFVIAQLHDTYIHFALYQAVQCDLMGKCISTAMLIIDKLVPMENLKDRLCKSILNNIATDNNIDYCDIHKAQGSNWDCYRLDNYKSVLDTLNSQMLHILSFRDDLLTIDDKIELNISTDCNCRTHTTLRNVIVNFRPVIRDITSIAITYILNMDQFYQFQELDHIFIFENTSMMKYHSLLYEAYTGTLQDEFNDIIELKEKDIQGVIMQKTINQSLKPSLYEEHLVYNAFQYGDPHKAAGNTYGLILKKLTVTGIDKPYLSYTNYKDDGTDACINVGDRVIVIQKGQIIPSSGIDINFKVEFEIPQKENTLLRSCSIELELVKLRLEIDLSSTDNFSFDKKSYDSLAVIDTHIENIIPSNGVNLSITNRFRYIIFVLKNAMSIQHYNSPLWSKNRVMSIQETKHIVYF